MAPTLKINNQNEISSDEKYLKLIDEVKEIETFISNFGYLSWGRDFVLCKNRSFSLQSIMISIELTAGNIVTCYERACLADSNTLLRKYRDDLFFYLYIIVYDSIVKLSPTTDVRKMENCISRWIQNGLDNLYIQDVLKSIGTTLPIKEAVKIYKLQSSFNEIGKRLNSFVHGNGYAFYNRNINAYHENECFNLMKKLSIDMNYITVTFIFLLILCSPLSVMASDYVDYLDCGESPPDGSQYWVAPFVERFLNKNIELIDENCFRYLIENTNMQFSVQSQKEDIDI